MPTFVRLPDSAAGGGDEERLRRARNADDVGDAAHEVGGADGAPAEPGDGGRIERRLRGLGERGGAAHDDRSQSREN